MKTNQNRTAFNSNVTLDTQSQLNMLSLLSF